MKRKSPVKARIEQCALALFVEKGVSATTIKDIAQNAEVAEGALYRHYKSKDELAKSLFHDAYATRTAEVLELIKAAPDFQMKLQAVAFYFCEQYDADPILFRYLLLSQYDHFDLEPNKRPIYLELVRLFAEAIKSKRIKIKDPAFGVSIFMGIIFQAALDRIYYRIDKTMKVDKERLLSAIFGALAL